MDVSRIEAISPKQVDWRKLTAPEIIEYKEQGIDVPSQYLQWAQSFLADVNAADIDETTYESANTQAETLAADTSVSTDTSSEVGESETEEGAEVPEEESKSPAEAKREKMESIGLPLFLIAKVFIKDSNEARLDSFRSGFVMASTASQSEDEIQALDNHMKSLLIKAEAIQDELKSEVDSVNDGDNDPSAIGKINKLNAQLQRMGLQAQANLAGVEGSLNEDEAIINAQTPIIMNAEDFGTETIGIGNDLLASVGFNGSFDLLELIYGLRAKSVGGKTVETSEKVTGVQNEALTTVSDGKSVVQDYKSQVQDKTGVEAFSLKENSNEEQGEDDKSSNDPAKNPEIQTKDMASANLEQILKAKIRKGENVGNDQLA